MSAHLGIDVVPANAPEEVPREADIIITASTSETPILFGEWLSRPCLVVAAGANHWYKREIDGRLIERANLIVVDDKDQARLESGNLLWAAAHGLMAWQRVEELGSVVSGRIEVPNLRQATILFGSHGLSTTDVAMAAKAYELARAHKLGTDVPL
jgi:ornithine cyclodeaminase/alanine dehydrogenase-like protein (mu-crystallin family)